MVTAGIKMFLKTRTKWEQNDVVKIQYGALWWVQFDLFGPDLVPLTLMFLKKAHSTAKCGPNFSVVTLSLLVGGVKERH